ncbi:MAG: GNAT family N-acetyltransferase [Gammaproteobacteria bacterium]
MLQIIRANLTHLDTIVPLFKAYRHFYGHESTDTEARNFLRERIERDESVIFLAQKDSQLVGFTQLYPLFSSVNMSRICVLNDLYVAESARRHGVASALLRAAAQHAKRTGARGLMLQTGRNNYPAQALYEYTGWKREDCFYWYALAV